MKTISLRVFLALALVLAGATAAHAQAVLNKTDFGKSQNTGQDLANSLAPGKPNLTKGEKKSEVDPKTLPSKSVKDPKFEGSLLNMGLGSADDPDLHQEKAGNGSDKDPKSSKQADAGSEKDSKVSKQAETSGDKDSKGSKSTQAGDGQNKDQKATSAAVDEKSPEKEKAAANKSDGDR